MVAWNCCFYIWAKKVTEVGNSYIWGGFEMVKCTYISHKNQNKKSGYYDYCIVCGFAHKTTLNVSNYFEACIYVCHCREIKLQLPMLLCSSWTFQLRVGDAYAVDLSQAAWRLFRPFLGRWNMKRDPAGYTSDVIRVQHTTERHRAAHARLLIPGTLSYRQLVAVCLLRPCA